MIRVKSTTLTLLVANMVSTLSLLPLAARAADEPAPAATSQATDAPAERIEVTGSHIKRIDTEGASPVSTITRKDIEKTGYNSVADVLRDASSNSFGSAREASGSNAAGNAEVDLRGLGSTNTLVLLNGQRMPTDAVTGAVDLNMVPLAAVERVEILKDGASAIYGSDALGGVVNIITKKDFQGTEINLGRTQPQMKGGARTDIGLVNGINGEKLNMVNVFQFRDNGVVYSRDRSWTSTNISTFGSPGSYKDSDQTTWKADPNCPSGSIKHTAQGDFCTFNTADYSTQLPALQQLSFLSETNYEMSSNLKWTVRVGGSRRKVNWSYAPAPGQFTIPAASVPVLPGPVAGKDLNVKYRLTDLGTRDSEVISYGGNALLGATLQLGKGWDLGLTATHNQIYTTDRGVNGYAIEDTLVSDIQNGSYNPFGTGNKGSLENARYIPSEVTKSQIETVEAKTSGEIAQMPEGGLGLAVGVQAAYQKYLDHYDDLSTKSLVFGNAGSNGAGDRSSEAAYTEFSIPAAKGLELQAAARYDRYSDFGDTINPKLAAIYHFNKDLLVRASWGTGFRAPLMQELHAAKSDGNPTFIDHVACKAEQQAGGPTDSCLPQQYEVISNGNSGLKQETSNSFNAGSVYQATKDLSFGLDWFMTKTKNVVGIDYDDMTRAEAAGVNVNSFGVNVHRDATQHIDQAILAPLQNLSSQEVSGIDLSIGYALWRFKISTDQSQLFYFKEEGFPGAGLRDKLGENGRPKWRNTTSLGFSPVDHQNVSLTAITIGGQEKAVKENGNISHYTSLDAQYVWTLNVKGADEVSFGIKNLLNTTPPLDDSNPTDQLNVTLYDQLGRQFLATYKVKF
jgi:iron complex outermembrane receptor protein